MAKKNNKFRNRMNKRVLKILNNHNIILYGRLKIGN